MTEDAQQISVVEIEQEVEELIKMREEHAQLDRQAKDMKNELTTKQGKLQAKLESLGLESYKGKAGTFSFRMIQGFKVPADMEAKLQFFDFLKEKGVFDEIVTVNSQTLNSWVQSEIEAAETQGNFDFKVPGLEKSAPRPKYTMTVAKPTRQKS